MFDAFRPGGIKAIISVAAFLAAMSLRLSSAQIYAALLALGALAWMAGWK